jgi:hypothetical protein
LGVEVAGSFASLYVVGILGTALFLSIGFCLGSLAKNAASDHGHRQPRHFSAGVPVGHLLPDRHTARSHPARRPAAAAEFRCNGLRETIVNGTAMGDILPTLAGLIVWALVALGLAIWLFVWKEVAA